MRIGIEAQRIFRSHKYGMDFAAIELIRHLQKIDRKNEYVVFVNHQEDICIQETDNFRIQFVKKGIYPVWEQVYLRHAIEQAGIELLHCTNNTAPIRVNVPVVLTLHDIISLESTARYKMSLYQELGRVYRKWVIPEVAPRCLYLMTVSQAERQSILRKVPVREDRIFVIHNGVSDNFKIMDSPVLAGFRKKYQLPEHYISFIGNTDPRKNIHNVLLAYAVYLKQSRIKIPLVILHYEEDQLTGLLSRLKIGYIRSHIRILAYLSTEDMPAFYGASDIFLFPSLREGFGMPVLESMACGTPVITSQISSMPEVAGDAALLVNPFDVDDMALNMLYLEEHPEIAATLREKGLKRVQNFSWEKMANQVLDVYEKALNEVTKAI